MRKVIALLVVAILASGSAMAATSWLGSFVYLNDGVTDTYYDLNEDTISPPFTGSIGSFGPGYTLWLNTEINVNQTGSDTFTALRLHYRVDGGAWTTDLTDSIDAQGGGNWRGNATGNSLSGLAVGTHTIELYLSRTHSWVGGTYTAYLNSLGGANGVGGGVDPNSVPPTSNFYGATFEVVPEPASAALFGLGLIGLMFARRRT